MYTTFMQDKNSHTFIAEFIVRKCNPTTVAENQYNIQSTAVAYAKCCHIYVRAMEKGHFYFGLFTPQCLPNTRIHVGRTQTLHHLVLTKLWLSDLFEGQPGYRNCSYSPVPSWEKCTHGHVCLIWFFTSHQRSFSYIGTVLPGLNQYIARINVSCSRTTTQWRRWGSNPRPFGLESSTLPPSHCAATTHGHGKCLSNVLLRMGIVYC